MGWLRTASAASRDVGTQQRIPGAKRLFALLDRDTFVLTQEELERLFLPLAREVATR